EPIGARLIAELLEDEGELALIRAVEQTRATRRGVGAHAHVERRAFPEGEAAQRIVELMRGDAEIEHDAIELLAGEGRDAPDVSEISNQRAKRSGVAIRMEAFRRRANRIRVAVDSGDARTASQQCLRVPATAQGTVQNRRQARKQPGYLGCQHRYVVRARPVRALIRRGPHTSASRRVESSAAERVACMESTVRGKRP